MANARCTAMTKAGRQCRRKSVDGSCFCMQHEKSEKADAVASAAGPAPAPVPAPTRSDSMSQSISKYLEEAMELFESFGLHETDLTDRKVVLLGTNVRTKACLHLAICAAGGRPATSVTTDRDVLVVVRNLRARHTKTYNKAIELGCEIHEEDVTS